MIKVEIDSIKPGANDLFVVMLRAQQSEVGLPIPVDKFEGDAIAAIWNENQANIGLAYTYDLLRLVIAQQKASVGMAIISSYRLTSQRVMFGATIKIVTDETQFEVVCNAQVAIALAVLTKAPIFVVESVIQKRGIKLPQDGTIDHKYDTDTENHSQNKTTFASIPNRILSLPETAMNGTEIRMEAIGIMYFVDSGLITLHDHLKHWRLGLQLDLSAARMVEQGKIRMSDPHNALSQIIERSMSQLMMAVITEGKEQTLSAKLVWAREDNRFGLECRPSDAITAALTAKVPIYAQKSILYAVN